MPHLDPECDVVIPSHYWTGPVAAVLVLAVVVLICRWVFSTPARPQRATRTTRADYGLLVPVATTRTAEDAERLCGRLGAAGIRCTVAEAEPAGSWQLMVFRSDAGRAGDLVRS